LNDARALWKAITLCPGEDTPKLALADLCQERGLPLVEAALRWCVARRVWPSGAHPRVLWIRQTTRPGRNHLPAVVFDALPMQRDGIPTNCLQYQSWYSTQAAIRALARSLERLRRAVEVTT